MSQPPEKTVLSEADFEAIAAAVNETERGRWFLAEYARKNRQADTLQVLEAIEKLQRGLAERGDGTPADSIRLTIADMSEAIARTKAEISAIKPNDETPGKIEDATIELDAIVTTTEQATSEILAAAELVQEIAWTLREQGLEPAVCDQLDGLMAQTYTACSFQDLTGQRIRKIVNVLNFLEARIEAMKLIWGKHETVVATPDAPAMEASLLNGPALPGEGLAQTGVDEILDPAFASAPEPAAELVAEPAPQIDANDDIFWEDAPVEEEKSKEAAMEAAAKLIAENIAADTEVALLAPSEAKAKPPAPAPIEQLSPVEKLALFS